MKIDEIISEIKKIIRKNLPKEYKIFLFGSLARGNTSDTSDIDIGILGNKKIDWSIMTKILNKVDDIRTLRSVDVLDLKTKSESFKKNVLTYAKAL